MKFKKIVFSIAASLFVFSLVACGADPRKEFVESIYLTDPTEYNAGKFEMSIKDLTYNGDQGEATVRMIANQLKDMTIDGTYAFDEKAKAIEMELNLNLLGQKVPFQMVGAKDKFYMSTNFISGITDLATAFGLPIALSTSDLVKLDGKYIDVATAGKTLTDGKATENNALFNDFLSRDLAKDKKYNAELKKLVESFDKKTFKKDKDTLSHTFTKDEFIKILEFANKNFKGDKAAKEADLDKQMSEAIKQIKKDIDKLEMKLSVNQKTKKINVEFTLGIKDPENKANDMSIVLAAAMTPQKNQDKIKLPAKKAVITQDELTSILNEISGATTPPAKAAESPNTIDSTELPAADVEAALNAVIEEINTNAADLDAATADEIRKSLEPILTTEQMKKLNEALDQALAI